MTPERGSLASLIDRLQLGLAASSDNQVQVEDWLSHQWLRWRRGDPCWVDTRMEDFSKYTRSFQAGRLASILNSLVRA